MNKKKIYESIMASVAKEVKKTINESYTGDITHYSLKEKVFENDDFELIKQDVVIDGMYDCVIYSVNTVYKSNAQQAGVRINIDYMNYRKNIKSINVQWDNGVAYDDIDLNKMIDAFTAANTFLIRVANYLNIKLK